MKLACFVLPAVLRKICTPHLSVGGCLNSHTGIVLHTYIHLPPPSGIAQLKRGPTSGRFPLRGSLDNAQLQQTDLMLSQESEIIHESAHITAVSPETKYRVNRDFFLKTSASQMFLLNHVSPEFHKKSQMCSFIWCFCTLTVTTIFIYFKEL